MGSLDDMANENLKPFLENKKLDEFEQEDERKEKIKNLQPGEGLIYCKKCDYWAKRPLDQEGLGIEKQTRKDKYRDGEIGHEPELEVIKNIGDEETTECNRCGRRFKHSENCPKEGMVR